jgi:hypothetical protein
MNEICLYLRSTDFTDNNLNQMTTYLFFILYSPSAFETLINSDDFQRSTYDSILKSIRSNLLSNPKKKPIKACSIKKYQCRGG